MPGKGNGRYILRPCAKCGKVFDVHMCQVERGYGRYCSKACARSGSPARKKARPVVQCHVCGKSFEKYRSELKKGRTGKNFCSSACWYEFNQRENHYGWEGGQSERMSPEGRLWRKAVLKRDGKACRCCNSKKKLQAHHINRFGSHPEDRWNVHNGITLCADCHKAVRGREEEYAEHFHLMAVLSFARVETEADADRVFASLGTTDDHYEAFGYTVASGCVLPPQAGHQAEG